MLLTELVRGAGSHEGTFWMFGWLVAVLVVGELGYGRRRYLAAVEQAERTREGPP